MFRLKPIVEVKNNNAFSMLDQVTKRLIECGMHTAIADLKKNIWSCQSHEDVVELFSKYVEIIERRTDYVQTTTRNPSAFTTTR